MPIPQWVRISHQCYKYTYGNYFKIYFDLSSLQGCQGRNYAYRCLSILSRMLQLWNCYKTIRGRLLCVL